MSCTTTCNKRKQRPAVKASRVIRTRTIPLQGEDRMERKEGHYEDDGERTSKGSDASPESDNTEKEILKEILKELKSIKKTLELSTKPKKKSYFDSTGTALRAPRTLL